MPQHRLTLAIVAATVTTLAATACSATSNSPSTAPKQSHASTTGTKSCQVTKPTQSGIPASLQHYGDGPWFGDGPMWVDAWWVDLKNRKLALRNSSEKYPYAIKYRSFTVQHGKVTDTLGHPKIHATRLDGRGRAKGGFGGYATEADTPVIEHFWPTVVSFSSHGCWQITESIGHSTIKFKVKI